MMDRFLFCQSNLPNSLRSLLFQVKKNEEVSPQLSTFLLFLLLSGIKFLQITFSIVKYITSIIWLVLIYYLALLPLKLFCNIFYKAGPCSRVRPYKNKLYWRSFDNLMTYLEFARCSSMYLWASSFQSLTNCSYVPHS
jgi:hypothetical protein